MDLYGIISYQPWSLWMIVMLVSHTATAGFISPPISRQSQSYHDSVPERPGFLQRAMKALMGNYFDTASGLGVRRSVHKRDNPSQALCHNPTFSQDRLNSNLGACHQASHSHCTVSFTWTNLGCIANATCGRLNLQQGVSGDSTVCWIQTRLFPSSLSGHFFVSVNAAGQNESVRFAHNYLNRSVEAAQDLRTTIDTFVRYDTIIEYTVLTIFPNS